MIRVVIFPLILAKNQELMNSYVDEGRSVLVSNGYQH